MATNVSRRTADTKHVFILIRRNPAFGCQIIGANFDRAMAATAPGEKFLIGHRPVTNWTRRTISSLFLCRKLHLFLENQQKLLPSELHFLTPICTKSFVGWGFASDPTGGAYSAPPDSSAVFRGPASKGRRGEGTGEKGRA